MSYRVIITADVEKQVFDCALYIARDNPDRALSWADDVFEVMRGLSDYPHASPEDPKLSRQVGRTIRRRAFGEYLIFYEVDEQAQAVVMHLFVHAKRER